jgi:hypothetical protein
MSMRYLLGTACLAISLGLLAAARAYRARVLARFDAAVVARLRAESLKDARSMASFGEIARPFVMFGLFYVAIKTTIAFVAFDATRTLSWLDLAGFHALLAGYGVWFTVRAKYWLPDAAVARELDRSLDAHMRANPAPPSALQDSGEIVAGRPVGAGTPAGGAAERPDTAGDAGGGGAQPAADGHGPTHGNAPAGARPTRRRAA